MAWLQPTGRGNCGADPGSAPEAGIASFPAAKPKGGRMGAVALADLAPTEGVTSVRLSRPGSGAGLDFT
jgi:hypothetical protein